MINSSPGFSSASSVVVMPSGHAADDTDMDVRIYCPTKLRRVLRRQYLAQGRIAPRDRVLVYGAANGLHRRLYDYSRRTEIRESPGSC